MAEITYAKAGVDIRKEERAVKGIVNWMARTFKFREGKTGAVMRDIGTFANVIDMGDFALAMCTDGVGTKVLVAQELKKYDTIGIDMVAMNVNDLICIGAEPIALVDYLAMEFTSEDLAKEIAQGIYEGARQAGVAVVGGETASLPDVIKGIDNRGFDIAGAAIGVVKKDRIITGERIVVGDVVIGLASSGVHSNGMTLARKVLPKNMWMNLLTPTKIYVKEVLNILNNYDIHGLAHITGSGFRNLERITRHGFYLDNLPEAHMIFRKIKENAGVSDEEMYKTFNMGVGFCVITDKKTAGRIIEKHGKEYDAAIIGSVVESGLKLKVNGDEISL